MAARRVGFIGLGQLGGPMCDSVVRAGHHVAAYDVSSAALESRVAAGARPASSPGDAAKDSEVTCVVVRDDAQLSDVLTGDQGVLAGAPRGAVVVVHSTVNLATIRALAAVCDAAGVSFVDAGLTRGGPGGINGSSADSMTAMCGGSTVAIELASDVIGAYADHIIRYGEAGAGMTMKLARNLVQYGVWAVISDGMRVIEAAGLDLADFAQLFRSTGMEHLGDFVLDRRSTSVALPVGASTAAVEQLVALGTKDIDAALALMAELDLGSGLASAVGSAWPDTARPA